MPQERQRPQHPFLAGVLTGIIEIFFTFPLEFVKVQLQLQSLSGVRAQGETTTWRDVVSTTWKKNGPLGFYRGFGPWIYFAPFRSSVRFATFEHVADACGGRGKGEGGSAHDLPLSTTMKAGLAAGFVEAAAVVTPMLNIQVKQTQDSLSAKPVLPRNTVLAGFEIWKAGGWRSFFSGVDATTLKGMVNYVIRFGIFHEGCKALRQRRRQQQQQQQQQRHTGQGGVRDRGPAGDDDDRLPPIETFAVAAFAGACSALCSHPIDTVKSQQQSLASVRVGVGSDSKRRMTSVECFASAFRGKSTDAEGLRGGGVKALYRGLAPRLVRVCAETGLLFTLFDVISHALDARLERNGGKGGHRDEDE